ncbi:hypothetical protein D3C72_2222080 [compost metagenome]
MFLHRLAVGPAHHEGQHVELHVGHPRVGHVGEAAALDHVGGEQPGAEHEVLRQVFDRLQALVLPQEGDGVAGHALYRALQVVLVVLAHARQVRHHGDTE